MTKSSITYDIYLEIGQKKVFAVAIDWPGWCRYDRDEKSAIKVLSDNGTRYAKVLRPTDLVFKFPETPASFNIVERVEGNSTTEYGAPDKLISGDKDPIDANELDRFSILLKANWLAFDEAVKKAEGKELRKGPRGGGRDLIGIIEHVLGAEENYLKRLGWKLVSKKDEDVNQRMDRIRNEVLQGLKETADGHLPLIGPRGGKRWPPRFFVRRLAWHVVAHAWEIEDRMIIN